MKIDFEQIKQAAFEDELNKISAFSLFNPAGMSRSALAEYRRIILNRPKQLQVATPTPGVHGRLLGSPLESGGAPTYNIQRKSRY